MIEKHQMEEEEKKVREARRNPSDGSCQRSAAVCPVERPVVFKADASTREDAVMITFDDALVAMKTMIGSRGRIRPARRAKLPSGLQNRGENLNSGK